MRRPKERWETAEIERAQTNDWHALLYCLVLRREGYAIDEVAAMVIERYPHTRGRLERLTKGNNTNANATTA